MNYAYKGKDGIIHIVDKKETAEESSTTGPIIETDIPGSNGIPLAIIKAEDAFIDCELGTIYLGGNGNHGKGRKVALSSLPANLQKLAVELGFKG
ncbi:MAG: hypothetical protein M0R80_13545 [Proteobacteria bacterium]|jgi:hypothetical protein|nr:hypothetical protein [Pseudomonadota bacterium]